MSITYKSLNALRCHPSAQHCLLATVQAHSCMASHFSSCCLTPNAQLVLLLPTNSSPTVFHRKKIVQRFGSEYTSLSLFGGGVSLAFPCFRYMAFRHILSVAFRISFAGTVSSRVPAGSLRTPLPEWLEGFTGNLEDTEVPAPAHISHGDSKRISVQSGSVKPFTTRRAFAFVSPVSSSTFQV